MGKRKYTKKNAEYWEKDLGYSDYIKEFKRIEKEIRHAAGVKRGTTWKQGLFVAGESYAFEVRTPMLNRAQYKRYIKAPGNAGITAAEVAASQFNLLTDKLAEEVQSNLKKAGITKLDGSEYSIWEIKARQLPQAVWDQMEAAAKNAGVEVSEYFFGS